MQASFSKIWLFLALLVWQWSTVQCCCIPPPPTPLPSATPPPQASDVRVSKALDVSSPIPGPELESVAPNCGTAVFTMTATFETESITSKKSTVEAYAKNKDGISIPINPAVKAALEIEVGASYKTESEYFFKVFQGLSIPVPPGYMYIFRYTMQAHNFDSQVSFSLGKEDLLTVPYHFELRTPKLSYNSGTYPCPGRPVPTPSKTVTVTPSPRGPTQPPAAVRTGPSRPTTGPAIAATPGIVMVDGYVERAFMAQILRIMDAAPVVNLAISPSTTTISKEFTIEVSGTDEKGRGLASIWWWGDNTGIAELNMTHTFDCRGSKSCTNRWKVSTSTPGNFKFCANARDTDYPAVAGAHQASEGKGIDCKTIQITRP